MQGLSCEIEVDTKEPMASFAKFRAVSLLSLLMSCFYLFLLIPSLDAAAWSYYERRGDEKMEAKRFEQARDYYRRAIGVAGDNAPRGLWEKYNRAFQKAWRKRKLRELAQKRRERLEQREQQVDRDRKAETYDGGPMEESKGESKETTSHAETPPTSKSYVEILPDGTVRMPLEHYLRGGGVTRVRPRERGRTSDVRESPLREERAPRGGEESAEIEEDEAEGPQPTSFWREPLADRRGGRSRFSPEEKVGLSTVRTSAGGFGSGVVEDAKIVTPEYEISEIRIDFIGTSKLLVKGEVLNKTRHPIRNARVYVRLYNDTGVFKGRNWGYLQRGRQTLNPGKTKPFEVKFFGYTGTVGSYKMKLVANFRR